MCGFTNSILLERSIDCIARKERFGAEGFVPCLTEITSKARTIEPLRLLVTVDQAFGSIISHLDTSVVTNFNFCD